MKRLIPAVLSLVFALNALAEIRSKTIEYREGDTLLEGLAVWDDAISGKRPGVLVVHQWKGLGPYEKKRAKMLAKLGYFAFAVDIYGKGVRADNPGDAAKLASKADRRSWEAMKVFFGEIFK